MMRNDQHQNLVQNNGFAAFCRLVPDIYHIRIVMVFNRKQYNTRATIINLRNVFAHSRSDIIGCVVELGWLCKVFVSVIFPCFVPYSYCIVFIDMQEIIRVLL